VKHNPLTADGAEAIADYTPVQLAARSNGWTADRQRTFLRALAETASVSVACKAAGITARSAYRLRADPRGAPFAAAWHRALYVATHAMVALAFERATKGTYREHWKNGELIAEIRQPSDTMLKFLLTRLMPSMFACKPQDNWDAAHYAQHHFPRLLDKLTDCDVRADRLDSADCEPQPRATAHDPLIPPDDENRSWLDEAEYPSDRWGKTSEAPCGGHGPADDGPDAYPPLTVEQRAAAYRLDDLDEDADDDLCDDDDDFDEDDLDDDDLDQDEDLDDDEPGEDEESGQAEAQNDARDRNAPRSRRARARVGP
jgi:hypothetical protein